MVRNINFNQRFDIGIVSPSYRIYNLSHQFDINFAKDLLKVLDIFMNMHKLLNKEQVLLDVI